MLALENKIEELESQGLSKKEIELQTQDLFNQLLNEELEEEKSYLADINLTIKIDSKAPSITFETLIAIIKTLKELTNDDSIDVDDVFIYKSPQ